MVKIHFLNVGHGDCTIIEHHIGNITMIDINNSKTLRWKGNIILSIQNDGQGIISSQYDRQSSNNIIK